MYIVLYTATEISLAGLKHPLSFAVPIYLIVETIKVLFWTTNVIDLPVCKFYASELATE